MSPLNRFYLDSINPLRGLDQAVLVGRIELGERGYYALLQWTYRAFEKRDPVVRAVKRRLLSALGSLTYDIKMADTGEDAAAKEMATKQAQALRAAYDAITNLRPALNFLALADLRGFSHLEKIYVGQVSNLLPDQVGNLGYEKKAHDDPWTVTELRIVEQWFWCREGRYAPWQYNESAVETNRTGDVVDLANFIVHEIDDPADEIFAEYGVKRRVNDADWDGFLEDFGIPPLFIGMPPNVPKERETEYQRTAELAVSAARGALPNGATLLSPSAGASGGAGVFKERLDYIDGQIVIAGTSGKLTVLAEKGSGTLAGNAQKEAFDEIAQSIADEISGVMQKQFDQPLLARLFPGEPVLAHFALARVDREDAGSVFDDAGKAHDAGFDMDEEELSEKTGYKLTRSVAPQVPGFRVKGSGKTAAPSLPAPAPNLNPEPGTLNPSAAAADPEQINELATNSARLIEEARAADLVPLRRALEGAIANPTPARLQELLASLPEIQTQLGTSEATAQKDALGTALIGGLTS